MGEVFWITGLAGAGKSSIARAVADLLREEFQHVVILDGDDFRALMGNDLGYSDADRKENAWRIARWCNFLAQQGIIVVCATISLYDEVRSWLRDNVSSFHVVFVDPPLAVLRARDQKGLYSSAEMSLGSAANLPVAGINQAVERPADADLVISNESNSGDFRTLAYQVLTLRQGA